MSDRSRSLFVAEHLVKRFGAVAALSEANLSVDAGEVVGLVGENGAGKSTLIRMATGLVRPDEGELRLMRSPFHLRSPGDAAAQGVRVVGQEFELAPNITVAENLCLSSLEFLARCRNGRFPWGSAAAWADRELKKAGVQVDPLTKVGRLSVSERQLVALVRATLDEPKLVFLDEPTSALDQQGVEILMNLVNRLREEGVAVVYVSHKLEEVFDLADRITVMRDGHVIAVHECSETTVEEIVRLMVGRSIERLFPQRPTSPTGGCMLEVKNLCAAGVEGVDFKVNRGEILGIGGLLGAGRSQLAKALTGLTPILDGSVRLDGIEVKIKNRANALKLGVEYVTEDRLGEGLVLDRSVAENVGSRVLHRLTRGPLVSSAAERKLAEGQMRDFKITAPDATVPVRSLSGGNQQKTLLAACLIRDPKVIFFDEPTRGIDVGAKAQIYQLIRDIAEDRGVVILCSELIELLGLADRIIIMRHGRFVAGFDTEEASEELLITAALGLGEHHVP